jgi:hypothetical protein
VAMFRLDYLSCFLTVVATILVGRKMWTGLVVSGVNSLIVCVIGLHTSQYGFIPANVFCICINAFNLRAWLKVQKDLSESTTDASSELVAGCKPMSTSKKAATRPLINSSESAAKEGSGIRSHLSLLKACGPSHQHSFAPTQTSGYPTYDRIYRTSGRIRSQARTPTGGRHNHHCPDCGTGLAVVGSARRLRLDCLC